MCRTRKLVVINKLGLGTRELGYEVYSLPKGEVLEFTAKQLRDIMKAGRDGKGKDEVYGLKIGENGFDLVFDNEGFFTSNIMYKVHIGSLTPMAETESMINLFYIVIGTHVEHGEVMYDVISSRFERTSFNGEKLRALLEMNVISGGAKLEHGKIIVAPLEKVKKPVEEVNALEEKPVAEMKSLEKEKENPIEKEKSLEKENPVEKEKSLEKEKEVPVVKEKSLEEKKVVEKENPVPVIKKEPEKVVKVEEKKKG